jgi:UDP-N-acetylglucosamine diphosphorylase / glucose-1-phosphate thymidylyltransferase / UDP-N-acetylgalactosamine diphosphorylase / glucosamine-1-phosphate N-acetyltransferase / galactosamine-1-phosphate N-acetyltransferase
MKAVILAAGEGKRLRPYTETMPKVMLPIANKPIIHHLVDALVNNGITEIIIVVGYKKESIMQHFKNFDKAHIQFAVQEKQLGTAHALLQSEQFIDDSFLVLSGDNIVGNKDIKKIIDNTNKYVMLIKEHTHPSKYGVVTIKNNVVTKLVKQPRDNVGRLISTGIYKFPVSIFDRLHQFAEQGDYSLFSVINYLLEQNKEIVTEKSTLWLDVVFPWDILPVNDEKLRTIHPVTNGIIEKNVQIKGPVLICENTIIHSGCYLVGPIVIGKNCEIGPNTCIFPSTTIGNNVEIRPFTELRNSVVMDDVIIKSNSFISHSIIGKGSIINNGFSTLVGDLQRHHQKECMTVKDMGVMIAEDSLIQSHVVTHPGVIIGRHCNVSPLSQIRKDIPSETRVM